MLCDKCFGGVGGGVLRGHKGKIWKGTYDLHFNHHNDLQDLRNSAALICGICWILKDEWNAGESKVTDDRDIRQSQSEPTLKRKEVVHTETHMCSYSAVQPSLSVVHDTEKHDLFRLDFHLECGKKTLKRIFVLTWASRQFRTINLHLFWLRVRALINVSR